MYTTVKVKKDTKALLDELAKELSKGKRLDYDSLIRMLVEEKLKEKTKRLEELKKMRVDADLQGLLREGRGEDERF